MKTIAFFNNKGGVGKTTLTYHLACMFSALGAKVLAVDLDPQANLTSSFLDDARLEELWSSEPAKSVAGSLAPLLERLGDVQPAHVEEVSGLGLIPGDLALARFEDRLGAAWPACLDDNPSNARDAFRVTSAFHRMIATAAGARGSNLALLDVGPTLGALNRAALVAADYVVVPLAADLFSLRGLQNLGPTLDEWRSGWQTRRARPNASGVEELPAGSMRPLGYVVLQHAARKANDPARAYHRWIDRIPHVFHQELLHDPVPVGDDPARLALIRHFRSLLPLAMEARKPVFELKAADGAIGSHAATVQDAKESFASLARSLAEQIDLALP